MAIKLSRIFFLTVGEAPRKLLLPSLFSLLSGGSMQLENTHSCNLEAIDEASESQKRINIDNSHSYHQRVHLLKSLSQSQQSYRKRWGTSLVDLIKHLPYKYIFMTTSLKTWPTNSKEETSAHTVRLTLPYTNPAFLSTSTLDISFT